MLLYWDSSSFGWRPVPNAKEINTHSRYVVAIEIDPEAYLKSIEAQEQDKK